jgi:hypothetical protein
VKRVDKGIRSHLQTAEGNQRRQSNDQVENGIDENAEMVSNSTSPKEAYQDKPLTAQAFHGRNHRLYETGAGRAGKKSDLDYDIKF